MSRLIDADALEKELEKMTLDFLDDKTIQGNFCAGVTVETLEEVRKVPTVDAVPVVRCGECKYYEEIKTIIGYDCVCVHQGDMNVSKEPDDYCSWGEKI